MKIRHRLSLLFIVSVTGVMLLLYFVIYYYSRDFHRHEFYDRLSARVDLTEKFFLEESRLPPDLARQVREQFLLKLSDEKEWLLDPGRTIPDSLALFLGADIAHLQPGDEIQFLDDKRHGLARIYELDGRHHLIVVTAVDEFGDAKLANLQHILLYSLPFSLVLVGMIGWFATRRALMPLDRNISRARDITASNLGTRLELPPQRDEIHDFASIINDLLDRLQGAFEFQKKFISNASHEIRNPLTVIAGEAEIALSADRPAADYRQSLETIAHEAERLHQLVNSLLSLARTGGEGELPDKEDLTLESIMQSVKDEVVKKHDISIISWLPIDKQLLLKTISCNPLLLRSALANLIDNAWKYDPSQRIRVAVEYAQKEWHFIVVDQGIGIPAEEIHLVAEPMYRASNARPYSGQGLGLAMVDRIARWHGGSLIVNSTQGQGTTATINIPG